MAKPGLGLLLLDGLGGELAATAATAVATVAAAVSIPGIRPIKSSADAAAASGYHAPSSAQSIRARFVGRSGQVDPYKEYLGPRSYSSLLDPYSIVITFAKNISLHLLIKLNVYMVALNDYEVQRYAAEEQGTLPPEAPQPPTSEEFQETFTQGCYSGFREMATKAVRLVYEHWMHQRLGPQKSMPFLRNGSAWVISILQPRHANSSIGKKVFSYTFALLHANVLFYASECTVAFAQHVYRVLRNEKHRGNGQKTVLIIKGAVYQTGRCTLLLVATSVGAAVGTLVKPGLGTRAMPLLVDLALNHSLQPVARFLLR